MKFLSSFLILLSLSFPFISCKKRGDFSAGSGSGSGSSNDRQTAQPPEKKDLQAPLIPPLKQARDRYLEYIISLSYECKNLIATRQEILSLIAEYGFLVTSRASTETQAPFMAVSFSIKSEFLYKFLKDADRLGKLVQESIDVVDHTESMVWKDRRIKRENIRVNRREKFLQKTIKEELVKEREDMLALSEDNQDGIEQEIWKILDSSSWAKINLRFQCPLFPEEIVIPPYRDAFTKVANHAFLSLYYLIFCMPLALVLALLIWLCQRILKRLEGEKRIPGMEDPLSEKAV